MDQNKMRGFAALVLDAGLGIGKGSLLRISAEFPHRELLYVIAAEAYERGAKLVRIDYDDQRLARVRVDHSADPYLDELTALVQRESEIFVQEGWSFLRLAGYEDADVMDGANHSRLTRVQRVRGRAVRVLREAQMASKLAWCVAPAATDAWARTVLGPSADAEQLWKNLIPILRLDEQDPAAALRAHMRTVSDRAADMTRRGFRELRFSGPGTELRIALSPDSVWLGGGDATPDGKPFMPNIPTEEVFTTPDFRGTEGRASLTRPVRIHGTIVEGGTLEFKNGVVVSSSARKGADALAAYIETDAGSHRLGEVALVDASSPIWKSGLVFDSMLLDENAACHIALGAGYDPAFKGVDGLSEDQKERRGFNVSVGHEDVMIGSDEVSVVGVDASGKETTVIRRGSFAI